MAPYYHSSHSFLQSLTSSQSLPPIQQVIENGLIRCAGLIRDLNPIYTNSGNTSLPVVGGEVQEPPVCGLIAVQDITRGAPIGAFMGKGYEL